MSTDPTTCNVCGQPLDARGLCRRCQPNEPATGSPGAPERGDAGHVWTIQDWRPLLTLALIIALSFSFTRLVVNGYDDERHRLAEKFYAAGTAAMAANHPGQAVNAFEGALIYSHDNFEYQLKLTDALLASGAASEAVAQLHAFLDQRPGDAEVNLKLARLEARRHHVDSALRYYVAALNGDWPEHTDPFPQRIAVRFESAEYLVDQGRKQEADNALQALAAVLPVSWPEQDKLGELFLRVGDAGRALNVFQGQLNQDPDDQTALMGAARASVSAASYTSARRYLLQIKPQTDESRTLLKQLDRMEALDPFAPHTTGQARIERTIEVFRIAKERLEGCGMAAAPPSGEAISTQAPQPWSELQKWENQLAPMMNEQKLRGRDDLIESTMRFVFQTELAAEKSCGKAENASVNDEALLLLARERMGAVQ